jgi:hypothetical protein
MRSLLLLLMACLMATVSCTKVKLTNSVGVVDGAADVAEVSGDASVDGETTDADVEAISEVVDSTDITETLHEVDADDATDGDACIAQCEEAECGDDGCGGSCGECTDGGVCVAGLCCAPACEDKACGDNGCEGQCGVCAEGDLCEEGFCVSGQICEPDCVDKYCDDDGCGGSCGECVFLGDLTGADQDKDDDLRALYGEGLAVGRQTFLDELGSLLAQAGLPGAVTLNQPASTGTVADLTSGDLKCPFLAFKDVPEPEEKDCDQWVNESNAAAFSDVVAFLADPDNLPPAVKDSPHGKDAEDAYLGGVKTGIQSSRARARWDLPLAANPVCDITQGPSSGSKAKGVFAGAQFYAATLNSVMESASFPKLSGTYPAPPSQLDLCSFAASLLDVAHDLANSTPVEALPIPEPCANYAAPPDLEVAYATATEQFLDGLNRGIEAEYYVSALAFFGAADCGVGP